MSGLKHKTANNSKIVSAESRLAGVILALTLRTAMQNIFQEKLRCEWMKTGIKASCHATR